MNVKRLRTVALASALLAMATINPVRAFSQQDLERLRTTHNCAACDLTGAQLPGLAGDGADFTNANFGGASLYRAQLRGAILTGAVLTGVNLSGANLTNAVGANLTGAKTDQTTVCPSGAKGPCK